MDNIDVTNQQHLVQALEGSVSTDDVHRKRCEEYLINFSLKEGSIISLMRVMSNFQLDENVRLASSIRLKNHVLSHWINGSSEYPSTNSVISNSDRAFLLDNLYLCLVSSTQRTIRNQCYEILRHLMFNVEIKEVKTLLTSISSDLTQRSNSDRVLCALYCLRKVVSKYEYHGKSQTGELNDLLSAYFGSLLSIALDASKIGFSNDEAATLIHLVLKIYFSSALLTSPSTDILKESLHHWMGLIKFVINEFVTWQQTWPQRNDMQVSMFSELSNEDEEYLSKLEQFKCFKWSMRIINRFMSRHNSFSDDAHKFDFYSSFISNNYSNENLVSMINLLKLESENKLLLNNLSHHLIWSYLRNSLSLESHFNYFLRERLNELLGIYCLNTFKYTKEDVENYQEDPESYIQSLSDICFQFYSNRGSCSDFLKDLVKSYMSQSLNEIKLILKLGFESTDNTVLYSVMCIIGYVSDRLIRKTKPQKSVSNHSERSKKRSANEALQIDGEELVELKVLGLLNSPDIWIRMRAAWLSGCILKRVYEFRNFETLKKVYMRLLELLIDPEIIVAVFAASAIIELFRIENDKLQQIIVGSISSLLERLFMLMNRIELESVTSVLGEIVDSYSHEVLPYAKDIILNITNNLTKNLLMSNTGGGNKDIDEDERVLVRWSMLQTLNTMVRLLTPSEASANKEANEVKKVEPSEDKLVMELNSYGVIITTIVNLLKLLFGSEDDICLEYLDEAAILLANLVRLMDVRPVKNLLTSTGSTGFSDFWLLFLQLLNLMRKSGFELVSDFGLVREPLVALARRDPQGFVKILDDFYRLCLEARNSGFGDEVDDVVADCLEVSLESGAVHSIFSTILEDSSTRVSAVVSNYPKSNMQDLASDNLHLIRLSSLVVMYYYQNLHASVASQAAAANQNVLNHLKVVSDFVVKYSVFCTWKSIRKYCILTCCTLLKNNVTKLEDTVNVLMILLQSPKDDKSDDYKYSSSDSDYDEDDEYDDDEDSEWSEYEFEDSPLNGVCEIKVAKQLLLGIKDSLNQQSRDNLASLLRSI